MANLGTWTIDTEGEYATIASVTELTLTEGTTYTVQIQNPAYIREGELGIGILIDTIEPFQFTQGSDDFYIKNDRAACIVNISA